VFLLVLVAEEPEEVPLELVLVWHRFILVRSLDLIGHVSKLIELFSFENFFGGPLNWVIEGLYAGLDCSEHTSAELDVSFLLLFEHKLAVGVRLATSLPYVLLKEILTQFLMWGLRDISFSTRR
jgi:hypothetical protein